MKKRLKEIEEEASALREMQAKVEKEMGAVQGLVVSFVQISLLISATLLQLLFLNFDYFFFCFFVLRFVGHFRNSS